MDDNHEHKNIARYISTDFLWSWIECIRMFLFLLASPHLCERVCILLWMRNCLHAACILKVETCEYLIWLYLWLRVEMGAGAHDWNSLYIFFWTEVWVRIVLCDVFLSLCWLSLNILDSFIHHLKPRDSNSNYSESHYRSFKATFSGIMIPFITMIKNSIKAIKNTLKKITIKS